MEAVGRAGCLDSETPQLRRAPGPGGGDPEPFAPSLTPTSTRAGTEPAHRAKPRPGCGLPRRGFAVNAASRGGEAPLRGVEANSPHPVLRIEIKTFKGCNAANVAVAPFARCSAGTGTANEPSASAQTAVIRGGRESGERRSTTTLTGSSARRRYRR